MKTEKLFHKSTGLTQDVSVDYVAAHLANGWERTGKEEAPPAEEPEIEEPEKGKRK